MIFWEFQLISTFIDTSGSDSDLESGSGRVRVEDRRVLKSEPGSNSAPE